MCFLYREVYAAEWEGGSGGGGLRWNTLVVAGSNGLEPLALRSPMNHGAATCPIAMIPVDVTVD